MNGVAILGLNGGGKSTLAHALAKHIGYYELDVEDCYFPEQSSTFAYALILQPFPVIFNNFSHFYSIQLS